MTSPIVILTALIASVLALAGAIAAWWNLRSLNRLRETFFAGTGAGNLEHIINSLAENLHRLEQEQGISNQELARLQTNFQLAVQKVGVVRFNPFADGGGNFSFSIALLNGNNTGVVITSMHGREQNRIYTKKIQDGKSDNQLTEEEQQAVQTASDVHQQNIK
jgi:hypothetical protein